MYFIYYRVQIRYVAVKRVTRVKKTHVPVPHKHNTILSTQFTQLARLNVRKSDQRPMVCNLLFFIRG